MKNIVLILNKKKMMRKRKRMVLKYLNCMNINIVLYVNVKEDTENVNDSEILKLFIERLRGHKG